MEIRDKLIVEENYLPEQIFSVDETSLFWKWMPERTFMRKEAKSMPDFKVRVSTLYDLYNILYTVSTQHQYSDIMYAVGYTVAFNVLILIDGMCLTSYEFDRSHPVVQ